MAHKDHINIVLHGPEAVASWRAKNPKAVLDLRGAELRRADFVHANLNRADLREADLQWADFRWADLITANLAGANVSRADFHKADCNGASFKGANLSNANFEDANLSGGDFAETLFCHTRLLNTDLAGTKGLSTSRHSGPSMIDLETLTKSGYLPSEFLRGCGLSDAAIKAAHSYDTPTLSSEIESGGEFYSCFISYSSLDEPFAERLCNDLQARGVRCWFAPKDMRVGAKIRDAVHAAIRKQEKLLLILSENSVASRWVEDEVEKAFSEERDRQDTIIFPIRVDDSVTFSKKAWADTIRIGRHIGDFRNWRDLDSYQTALEVLLRDLKKEGSGVIPSLEEESRHYDLAGEDAAADEEFTQEVLIDMESVPRGEDEEPTVVMSAPTAEEEQETVDSASRDVIVTASPRKLRRYFEGLKRILGWRVKSRGVGEEGEEAIPDPRKVKAEPPTTESIEFTVCHPHELRPKDWYTLLAYVHFPQARKMVDSDCKERLKEEISYGRRSEKATQEIARGSEILIVPELPGCRFNPDYHRLLCVEDWHRAEFRVQASPDLPGYHLGMPVTGRVSYYLESVLVGEVAICALFSETAEIAGSKPLTPSSAKPYEAIFVSYAYEDSEIVEILGRAYKAIGMAFLRDVEVLRSGEQWNSRLLQLIENADIFQLYWSEAARKSTYVEQEWQHALAQNKENFIRPVYWQRPMPEPPRELAGLHFAFYPHVK